MRTGPIVPPPGCGGTITPGSGLLWRRCAGRRRTAVEGSWSTMATRALILVGGILGEHERPLRRLCDVHAVAVLEVGELRVGEVPLDGRPRRDGQRDVLVRRGLRALGDRQLIARERLERPVVHGHRLEATAVLLRDDQLGMDRRTTAEETHARAGAVAPWLRVGVRGALGVMPLVTRSRRAAGNAAEGADYGAGAGDEAGSGEC